MTKKRPGDSALRRHNRAQARHEHARAVHEQTYAAKARFDAAHRKGEEALASRDFDALGAAVREERAAIDALPKPTLNALKPLRKKRKAAKAR